MAVKFNFNRKNNVQQQYQQQCQQTY